MLAKGNDVITNVISPNPYFASTFSMQIFKFQRRSFKLSFFFPPNVITGTTSSRKGDKKKRKRVQRSPVSCGRDALIKFVEAAYRDKSKNRKFLPFCHRNTRLGCVLTKAIITLSLGRPVAGGEGRVRKHPPPLRVPEVHFFCWLKIKAKNEFRVWFYCNSLIVL